jgi:hypothetical protein
VAVSALWMQDDRSEPRDAVHHRARAAHADGRVLPLVVVNTSSGGLMARCEASVEPGDRMTIELPVVGSLPVEVRWALGGRVGCRIVPALALGRYYDMLAGMRR